MLDFLKVAWTRTKDLFNEECVYYVTIDEADQLVITVRKPSLNRAALTWKQSDCYFSGSTQELSDFIENLKPKNNVVHIR